MNQQCYQCHTAVDDADLTAVSGVLLCPACKTNPSVAVQVYAMLVSSYAPKTLTKVRDMVAQLEDDRDAVREALRPLVVERMKSEQDLPVGNPAYFIDPGVEAAYRNRLSAHITAVQEFGRRIGVDENQLLLHDSSKWEPVEFIPYARYFVEHGGSPVDRPDVKDEFVRAWLHHLHHNPHHWQHWIFPDGYCPSGSSVEPGGVVEMPKHFALEMIADWHGAGYAYTGSWDIAEWLSNNMPRIRVHSKTAAYLRETLDHLGYADVVWMQRFAHEQDVSCITRSVKHEISIV